MSVTFVHFYIYFISVISKELFAKVASLSLEIILQVIVLICE